MIEEELLNKKRYIVTFEKKIKKAPMCWEATKGKCIYVAVIDTGIAPSDLSEHNLYCS
ncbi:MAG TPA: hypothetical protein VMW53_04745 [archaeon]|nr:hypothetical protein [archaeon]